MLNIIDIVVLLIILISVYSGYKKGFIKTVVSLLSFFIAIGLALMFYKPLAIILTENTTIDNWIVENITSAEFENTDFSDKNNLSSENNFSGVNNFSGENDFSNENNYFAENNLSEEQQNDTYDLESILEMIGNLPTTVTENFELEELKENTKLEISYKISELIMNLLSLIIIYVIVKITLYIATFILDGIMRFPVLKQLNEVLGMVTGAVIGFIQIYVVFAVITFMSSICDISVVISAIKLSAFARVLFENNLIINLLF